MIGKKWIGVEDIISQKLPHAAMELIGAGLGHQIGDGSSAVAKLCRVVQRQQLKLFHCVLDGLIDRSPAQAFVGDTVNKESIKVLADPVYYRIRAVFV